MRRLETTTNLPAGQSHGLPKEPLPMHWFGVLFATIGAGAVLGALTFVSALVGALITAMIVLFCGPLIDRLLARRDR